MWSDLVVVPPPIFDDPMGVRQADEPVRVQTLVPKPADEAFGKRVLNRFTRPDEIQLHSFSIRPLIEWDRMDLMDTKVR
jgi:hypothetical protein